MNIKEKTVSLLNELPQSVKLVAVSKTKSNFEIMEAYKAGQRIFGENRIQEMTTKFKSLPEDIQWHMIGHVQSNKVKYMAPYVSLIHSVDSVKLLNEINKQAIKNDRIIKCLLQIQIADEETKFGMTKKECLESIEESKKLKNICIKGLMGMATLTDNLTQIGREFEKLKDLFDDLKKKLDNFEILSMGMSGDYHIAISKGTNMIRVGSKIFGNR